MLTKTYHYIFLITLFFVLAETLKWDLAVVVENNIQLLSSDGSEIQSRSQPFTSLKAITYDAIRDQFIVSDTDKLKNDTIYTVRFNKETESTDPIIQGLPGDVTGLAIDSLEDTLYWTDSINSTINYVLLNDTTLNSKEFVIFENKVPHAIAIDPCNRYIYYTNPHRTNPTIERMRLDKTEHEILVSNTIMSPVGLAIDYKDQRLYWADSRAGTSAGRIESITLDGRDRKLVVERVSMEPYGLAIDDDAIYWTDTNNNVLYRFLKSNSDAYSDPQKIVLFSGTPKGLIANHHQFLEDCGKLSEAIKEYQELKEDTLQKSASQEEPICLNGGKINGTMCDCKRGFRGASCEISFCDDNYCLNGYCYLSPLGQSLCNCEKGYIGKRCQKNKCDDYCLNEGTCSIASSSNNPKCKCLEGFVGNRCEYNEEICDIYCKGRANDRFPEQFETMCRCSYTEWNVSSVFESALDDKAAIIQKLQDPVLYLSALLLLCLILIISLVLYIRVIKKRRPRIKKRIIVNKNITPLTYRPQQPKSEQCEITIENCCNMNICETPCFEPTGEDKKNLLTNMEGEEIY